MLQFLSLHQTEFANGWDAYFYLVQLKSVVEEGVMHSPDNALIYPFLRFLYFLSGNYIFSFKLGSAILASLFTLMAFLLGRRWTGSFEMGVLLASWTIFSPHLTYFAAQYPKNLLGMVLFLCLLIVWKLPVRAPGWIILGLNYFGHKLTFGISLIYIFFHLVFTRIRIKWAAILGVGCALMIVIAFWLSGGFQFASAGRFAGMIIHTPQFSPLSFLDSFGPDLVSHWWKAEIAMSVFFYVLISIAAAVQYFLVNKSKPAILAFALLGAFLLFPFWAWSLTSFAYRFFLVFVLLVPFMLTFFDRLPAKAVYFCSLALIFLSLFSWKSYNPGLHDPSYAGYHLISEETVKGLKGKPVELIIAHNSLAEYFTFSTGIDCMPWRPDFDIPVEGLWRIATGVKEQMFRFYLTETEFSSIKKVTNKYFLVKEDVWQVFLENVRKDDIELYDQLETWRNPYRVRPSFLGKKKKNEKSK